MQKDWCFYFTNLGCHFQLALHIKLYMYGTNNNLLVQYKQLQNFVETPKDKVN